MPYITDATLKAAVAGSLGVDGPTALPAHWDKIVPWANRDAYQRIRAYMMGRGYTAAQVDAWEARAEFNERLGVCTAIKRAAMRGEDVNVQAAIEECKEVVEELKTIPVVLEDALATSGRVSFGDVDTGEDRFTLDEPDGDGRFSEGGSEL